MDISILAEVAQLLEGQYKWHVIIALILMITAFITRFIFRTMRWFLAILAFGFIIFYLWSVIFAKYNENVPNDFDASRIKEEINYLRDLQGRAFE